MEELLSFSLKAYKLSLQERAQKVLRHPLFQAAAGVTITVWTLLTGESHHCMAAAAACKRRPCRCARQRSRRAARSRSREAPLLRSPARHWAPARGHPPPFSAGYNAVQGVLGERAAAERHKRLMAEKAEILAQREVRRVDVRADGAYYSDEELTDDELYGRLPWAGRAQPAASASSKGGASRGGKA